MKVFCAHADRDGEGAHWIAPGERCPLETVDDWDEFWLKLGMVSGWAMRCEDASSAVVARVVQLAQRFAEPPDKEAPK